MQQASEAEQIRQLVSLAKDLTRSNNPLVQHLAIQVLGLGKLLVAEVTPDEFEHVSAYEALLEPVSLAPAQGQKQVD